MQEPFVIEVSVAEFDHIFKDTIGLYNQLIEVCKETGILRGRELARLTESHQSALKAEKSPVARLLLVNAFIRQLIARIRKALPKLSPSEQGTVRQAITKIQLRAEAIVSHIRIIAEGKEKISLNSGQARQYLAGMEGKAPSRRDAIRALRRAEKLCPALQCNRTPNDGRQTMRLTAKAEDLKDSRFVEKSLHRDTRQRSRMDEVRMIFFKEGVF